jgi:uncharacterized membrane protein
MISKALKYISDIRFIFGILTLLVLIINFDIIFQYLKLNFITGSDGSTYVTVGQYYAENIFPSVYGWIPNWFAGMPFPQFYPPLFFILTAFLYKIFFFFEYITIFKYTAILLQILVPGLLALLTFSTTKNIYATWSAGLISLFAVSNENIMDGSYGITIHSTIMDGFVAQLLGFILLILLLYHFLKIEDSVKSRYLAGIFLCGVFLSNVHVVPVAGIYFLITFIVKTVKYFKPLQIKKIKNQFILYFLSGSLPLLIASFWYFPLLKN